ncbi:MAG: UDP-N-acetylmuramate--L-alanine ligase [Chloroflexi bacterium]|nr:UDP-N-acetylmuramate--L-alanine ligase [Chloroflexota bacterium]
MTAVSFAPDALQHVPPRIPARVHFVGIGGVGMAALAGYLMDRGTFVSGSDLRLNPLTSALRERGAPIAEGHDAAHLPRDAEMVVYSSAVPADNPELLAARRRDLPVIKRAALLGHILNEQRGIAVAGTHGKTTTTAMIALILEHAGLDPSYLVGANVPDLHGGARAGSGPYVVAEADEFDGSLAYLTPHIAVITNVEAEHLDYFGTEEGVVAAFRQFALQVPLGGSLFVCVDDPRLQRITASWPARAAQLVTYALDRPADWTAAEERIEGGRWSFVAHHAGLAWARFSLRVPGRHNVANALVAAAVAERLGVTPDLAGQALESFRGAARRFEVHGTPGGVTIVDDYAHHPTEIRATLRAARARFLGRRIAVLFQPHLYSRTRLLRDDFVASLSEADLVVVADIYGAREPHDPGVSSQDVALGLPPHKAHYGGDLQSAAALLIGLLRPGDVVFTMGAGDVNTAIPFLRETLSR